jgi:putative acetyltransferase
VNLRFVDVDPQGEAAQSLLRAAAVEVRALYDDVLAPDRPWPTNDRLGPRDVYVVAYCDQQPIGCGALREIDRITAEVRRMYVLREHRRNRVGHAVLTHLAAEAKRLGYERLRLETGNKQARAVALYEAFGFRRIAPFGKYENDPTSVCFELQLHHEVCMQDEICVFTASGEMQAQQIQGFLAGSGISSELRGESLRKTHGLTIDGLGRVEVVVSKDDEEQARALLASAEQGAFRLDEDAQVQE